MWRMRRWRKRKRRIMIRMMTKNTHSGVGVLVQLVLGVLVQLVLGALVQLVLGGVCYCWWFASWVAYSLP